MSGWGLEDVGRHRVAVVAISLSRQFRDDFQLAVVSLEVVHESVAAENGRSDLGVGDDRDLALVARGFHHAFAGKLAALKIVAADVGNDHVLGLLVGHLHVESKDGHACLVGLLNALAGRLRVDRVQEDRVVALGDEVGPTGCSAWPGPGRR